MSSSTRSHLQAVVTALAPAVLLAGFVLHPFVARPTDAAAIAEAVAAEPTRWGFAHVAIGLGYALSVLAFLAVRIQLGEAGEERWSSVALPFAALGCALLAILPGMEFAPLAAAETGGDPEAAQEELVPWFVPILLTGGIALALGAAGFAMAIARSGVLGAWASRIVVGALLVLAVARFVPLGAAQVVVGVAGIVALWPLAYKQWEHAVATAEAPPRPTPAA